MEVCVAELRLDVGEAHLAFAAPLAGTLVAEQAGPGEAVKGRPVPASGPREIVVANMSHRYGDLVR